MNGRCVTLVKDTDRHTLRYTLNVLTINETKWIVYWFVGLFPTTVYDLWPPLSYYHIAYRIHRNNVECSWYASCFVLSNSVNRTVYTTIISTNETDTSAFQTCSESLCLINECLYASIEFVCGYYCCVDVLFTL